MDTLAYKPDAPEVVQRLRQLHARLAGDRIFAVMEIPTQALAEFRERYAEGYCDEPKPAQRAAFWDKLLSERAAVEDDSIPNAYLSEMDQGLYGGVLGGRVQFMAHPENGWISSMVPPLLDDWTGLEDLVLDDAGRWYRRYLDQLDTFARAAAGKFAVSHFILIDGLNFCFELVGATRTYLGLHECPDVIRRAIEVGFALNATIHDAFFDRVGLPFGGTASNMVQWAPGRVVSESVDPFHMTSVDDFERWGREPAERIFARYDGGVLHVHGNGRHLLEAVSTLTGLVAIYLGDDRGFPPAIDVLAELQQRTGDVPLVVSVGLDRFIEKLDRHELPGGVLYQVGGAPSIDAANRVMERVRAYRV